MLRQAFFFYTYKDMKYYGVKEGRNPGVYKTWDSCKKQVDGYSGAVYKKFNTYQEAMAFVGYTSEVYDQDNPYLKQEEGLLHAYIDGSYQGKDKSYSYGAVMIDGEDMACFSKRFPQDSYSVHRNVSGEVKGAEFAFDYGISHGYKKIIVYYDYEGIEKWALGLWKTNTDLTRKYKLAFDQASDQIVIEFIKVQAHSGNKYNDLADKLAKEASL